MGKDAGASSRPAMPQPAGVSPARSLPASKPASKAATYASSSPSESSAKPCDRYDRDRRRNDYTVGIGPGGVTVGPATAAWSLPRSNGATGRSRAGSAAAIKTDWWDRRRFAAGGANMPLMPKTTMAPTVAPISFQPLLLARAVVNCALSQLLTKTLWPAVFPQGTYRVQYRCQSCRARSGRPEGTITSAEFVPEALLWRDASRVGHPCDAD